jgi:hypothetical protein
MCTSVTNLRIMNWTLHGHRGAPFFMTTTPDGKRASRGCHRRRFARTLRNPTRMNDTAPRANPWLHTTPRFAAVNPLFPNHDTPTTPVASIYAPAYPHRTTNQNATRCALSQPRNAKITTYRNIELSFANPIRALHAPVPNQSK